MSYRPNMSINYRKADVEEGFRITSCLMKVTFNEMNMTLSF